MISSDGSGTDVLNPVIMKAIKEAAEQAVLEAIARMGGTSTTLSESSLDDQDSPKTHITVDKRVPKKVWEQVFKHLYPSQLSRVSMVCRTFCDIVTNLPIWLEIYTKIHPQAKNHLIGGIKPEVGKSPPKHFMLHVCAESLRICELCLSVHQRSDVSDDRLASLPLPVHVWRVRAVARNIAFLPFSSKNDPREWTIRLCLGCRRKVFDWSPESIPKEALGNHLSPWELTKKYHLSTDDISTINERWVHRVNIPWDQTRYSEEAALMKARSKFGGDVGIASAAPKSSSNAVKSLEARLEEVCLRLTRESADC